MGKKVLILSGSPRRGGNSDMLCDEFLRGAADAGNEVMQMHFGRWAAEMYPQISMDQPKNPEGAYVYWQQRVERAKNVMKKRPTVFWNMMKAHFKLSEEEMVFYFGACPVIPEDAI